MYRGFLSSIHAARHLHERLRADVGSIEHRDRGTRHNAGTGSAGCNRRRPGQSRSTVRDGLVRAHAQGGSPVRCLVELHGPRLHAAQSTAQPERDYWAKLAVGKAPKQPPLPEPRPGDPLEWTRDGALSKRAHSLPKPPDQRPGRKRTVRRQLPDRHPLVGGAKPLFEAGRLSWHGKYLKPAKKLLVDLVVAQTGLDKAIAFANELFLALEARDHRVVIAPNPERFHRADVDERENPGKGHHHNNLWSLMRCTVVYIGTVAIGLTVIEMSKEAEARCMNGEYVRLTDFVPKRRGRYAQDYGWTSTHGFSTGCLCLQAYSPYPRANWTQQWRETPSWDLSGRISAIVRELEKATVESRDSSRRESARRRSNASVVRLSASSGAAKRRRGGPRRR